MNGAPLPPSPDEAEAHFLRICEELEQNLVGASGYQCILIVESWQLKYEQDDALRPFVRNHVSIFKNGLLKDPGGIVVGNNSNVQIGTGNISNAGNNVAGGVGNAVVAPASGCDLPVRRTASVTTFAACSVAGAIAGWWCCPQDWALGHIRLTVTVFFVVTATVLAFKSWLRFRRSIWERGVFLGLGAILILRPVIPVVSAWFFADVGADSPVATINAYFGMTQNSSGALLDVVAGLYVLTLAYFVPRESTTAEG